MNVLIKTEPYSELILTRYLYSNDEVFLSMLSSMIHHNLNKTLFWFGEWINSISIKTAQDDIWKIYYDFYSIMNPKIERYIEKKFKLISRYKNENINNPLIIQEFGNIIKNLCILNCSSDVFLLRQFINNNPEPKTIYKGRRPKWLQSFEKEYHTLLLSLNKRNWKNVCFYYHMLLHKYSNKDFNSSERNIINDTHNIIITYFNTIEKISINMDFVFKKWLETSYSDKKHLLLTIIVYLTKDEKNIETEKKLFVSLTQKDIEMINNPEHFNKQYEDEGEDDKKTIIKPYQKLKTNRLYQNEQTIGSFNLSRFHLTKDYKEIYRHNWEYFACRSKIWRERLKKFDFEENHEKLKIIFKDDPEDYKYEEFYEQYGYEPDEQLLEVQEKSTCEIPKMEYKVWLEEHFPETEFIIDLHNETTKKMVQLNW